LNATDGRFPERPSRLIADTQDSFDIWSDQREGVVRKHFAKYYLPNELRGFESELNEYGRWIYLPALGHAWLPGGVGMDWKPYYHGRWIWLSLSGWTWLPFEPWGWVTFHYGRWHWNASLGWYWIPTAHWGPGWVSWYWGDDYWAWAPLSYWGYPGVIINDFYYGRYEGEIPYNSRALTIVHKDQLQSRDVSRIAINQDSIKKLDKIKLLPRTPDVKLENHVLSVEKLDEKRVLLRKDPGTSEIDPGKRQILNRRDIEEKSTSENLRSRTIQEQSPSDERNILRRPTGYPSSSSISRSRTSSSSSSRYINPRASVSRFYDYISKGTGRYLKSVPENEKITVPPVTSRQSSPPRTSNRSSTQSSSSKASGSSKTKKKK
jgi:hypothetical protein